MTKSPATAIPEGRIASPRATVLSTPPAALTEPEKAPEQAGEVPLNLETTRRFAQVLEKEQGLMEDERAVEELQHMQKTTESICAWLEAHPESLPRRPAALRNTISPPP